MNCTSRLNANINILNDGETHFTWDG